MENGHAQARQNLVGAQNGGSTGAAGEDSDMADGEGDDSMDEDMMDKISSSPSIDDGGYSLPQYWPRRVDSLSPNVTPLSSPTFSNVMDCGSSSPFVATPLHYPIHLTSVREEILRVSSTNHHHPRGKYSSSLGSHTGTYDSDATNEIEEEEKVDKRYPDIALSHDDPLDRKGESDTEDVEHDDDESAASGSEALNDSQITHPDNSGYFEPHEPHFDLEVLVPPPRANGDSILRAKDPTDPNDPCALTIPYESSEEDDDTFIYEDSRFIDSGWGGDCLQETEDIDFEFVYALHTFVATIEGQANATKGETMVLLDDSNSYWWLVRVVKDSSIGRLIARGTFGRADIRGRISSGRTHRNANRETSAAEQAQEY